MEKEKVTQPIPKEDIANGRDEHNRFEKELRQAAKIYGGSFEESGVAESSFVNGAKYILKQIEEGKDAIEFKNWCDSGKAWFFDNNEEHTHTTQELYQLFKNNQHDISR